MRGVASERLERKGHGSAVLVTLGMELGYGPSLFVLRFIFQHDCYFSQDIFY
jgi:hypothetical protein